LHGQLSSTIVARAIVLVDQEGGDAKWQSQHYLCRQCMRIIT
jgi:hypothetical protein